MRIDTKTRIWERRRRVAGRPLRATLRPVLRALRCVGLGVALGVLASAGGCKSAPDEDRGEATPSRATDDPTSSERASTEPAGSTDESPAPDDDPAPGEPDLAAAVAAADEPGVLDVDCEGWTAERDPAPTMSHHGAPWLERPERLDEENPPALIDALDLEPGMTVADIGAGIGYHSALIAPEVAPGTVYATDIQPEMLAMLEARIEAENVETVLVTGQDATGLPRDAVDLAIMVDVYHELSAPRAVLDDLSGALRDGGQLVLVEFRADDPSVPIKPEHAMTVHRAVCELREHGWTLVARHDALPWQHVLFFEPADAARE